MKIYEEKSVEDLQKMITKWINTSESESEDINNDEDVDNDDMGKEVNDKLNKILDGIGEDESEN